MASAIDSILRIALSGRSTSQSALSTTSNNIANVNTPGFVRREVVQETRLAGIDEGGVRIAEIRRVTDEFLIKQFLSATASARNFRAQTALHDQLQTILGRPDENTAFSGRINDIFAGFADLPTEPDSTVRRIAALNGIQAFGDEVSRTARFLQDLRGEADRQIREAVTTINDAIVRIHELNPLIGREILAGRDANTLEEQRARAIQKIAEQVDVQTFSLGNGFIGVSTVSGVTLVNHLARELVYEPPGIVSSTTRFAEITVNKVDPITGAAEAVGTPLDRGVRSGKLRGLLDMRNVVLVNFAEQIGQLSARVIDRLNAAHNDNSAVPPASSLVGRNTGLLATDAHGFTGTVTLATVGATNNIVNRVAIDFTAGTIATNGGGAVAFSDATLGDVINDINGGLGAGAMTLVGGVLTFQAPVGAAGVATLQDTTTPSSRGGRGFAHFFGLNDLVEARVNSHFDTGLAATDSHGFANGEAFRLQLRGPNSEIAADVTITFPVAGGTIQDIVNQLNTDFTGVGQFALDANGALAFTPAATHVDFKLAVVSDTTDRGGTGVSATTLFGIGQNFITDAAQAVKVKDAFRANVNLLALAKLDLTGQPALTVGDGRGALALQAITDEVVTFSAVGNLSAVTTSLSDYAASVISDIAVRAEQAQAFESDTVALETELEIRISQVSGVNLDEELGNMILFQNAFNASARMIATAREMFEVLLELA